MILEHGTTLLRAESIIKHGPDAAYLEPGGLPVEDGFHCYVSGCNHYLKSPDEYARRKAKNFPDEGGAVVLIMDVPDEIVELADDPLIPVSKGLVHFDYQYGLEELLAAWHTINKHIRPAGG